MSKKLLLALGVLSVGLLALTGCTKEEPVDNTPPKGASVGNVSTPGGAPAPTSQSAAPQKPAGPPP